MLDLAARADNCSRPKREMVNRFDRPPCRSKGLTRWCHSRKAGVGYSADSNEKMVFSIRHFFGGWGTTKQEFASGENEELYKDTGRVSCNLKAKLPSMLCSLTITIYFYYLIKWTKRNKLEVRTLKVSCVFVFLLPFFCRKLKLILINDVLTHLLTIC